MVAPGAKHHVDIEGTWEELVQQRPDLAGRKVRVVTVDDAVLDQVSAEEWRRRVEAVIAAIEQTDPDPTRAPVTGESAEFVEHLVQDMRRQGLTL